MIIIYNIRLFQMMLILMILITRFLNQNRHMLKKTCSYYIMHITVAMAVGYLVTGNFLMALTLSLLEPSIQAVAYFFHEKAWSKKSL